MAARSPVVISFASFASLRRLAGIDDVDVRTVLGRLRRIRPTRRGYAVAAIAAVALFLGATAGARSLNAVVVPALVGLLAAAVQLATADPPTVRRSSPRPGFPGETRRVVVEVEAAVPVAVTEAIDPGGGVSLVETDQGAEGDRLDEDADRLDEDGDRLDEDRDQRDKDADRLDKDADWRRETDDDGRRETDDDDEPRRTPEGDDSRSRPDGVRSDDDPSTSSVVPWPGSGDDSLAGPSAVVGHGGSLDYEIELERRGAHELGPAWCRVTDSLGLFSADVETDATSTAVVYPDVYRIEGDDLASLVRHALGDDRASFERLREFAPGDAMRDIHWRASARRASDDYLVAEYRSRAEPTHVSIVGESSLGSADTMASTVASIGLFLHDAGVTVSVAVPDGECVAHPGDAASLLRLLALTGDGWVDREAGDGADVHVQGEGGRAIISLGDRELPFDGVAGDHRGREVLA